MLIKLPSLVLLRRKLPVKNNSSRGIFVSMDVYLLMQPLIAVLGGGVCVERVSSYSVHNLVEVGRSQDVSM